MGRDTHGPNRRVYLDPRKVQVPAEGQANHVNVLLAIAEGASQSDIHWEEDAHWLDLVCCTGRITSATSTRLSPQQSDHTTLSAPGIQALLPGRNWGWEKNTVQLADTFWEKQPVPRVSVHYPRQDCHRIARHLPGNHIILLGW